MADELLEIISWRRHALRDPTNPISIGELQSPGEMSWCHRIGRIRSNSSTSWASQRDPQDPRSLLHEVQLRHPEWKCP